MRVESTHVLEVDEDALGRFRPEVDHAWRILLDRADEGLEHQIELAGFGELAFMMFAGLFAGFAGALAFGDLVGAEAGLAAFAIDQGVGEVDFMTRGLPDGAVHEDGAVEADDIAAGGDVVMPPGVLDIAEEFDAQRAVIPRAIEAAVDFGAGIDKPSAFAEGDEFFHDGKFSHGDTRKAGETARCSDNRRRITSWRP